MVKKSRSNFIFSLGVYTNFNVRYTGDRQGEGILGVEKIMSPVLIVLRLGDHGRRSTEKLY